MKFIFIIFNFWVLSATASPYPGMGSSILVNSDVGAYLSFRGFHLQTPEKTWSLLESEDISTLLYKMKESAASSTATLAVKINEVASTNLETLAKKWMREYSQFGFEILGTQNIPLAQSQGLVVDLIQKSQNQQLRQVLLLNKNKMAVFTCKDKRDTFEKALPACNQVVRSFQWR